MPEWISSEEASELTGYARDYLRRIIRQGRIAARKQGTMWWIDRDSLKTYAEEMQALGNQRHDPRGHAYKADA